MHFSVPIPADLASAALALSLEFSLLLSAPVAALFVIFADAKRSPQSLALLDLRLGQFVNLVRLEASRIWS